MCFFLTWRPCELKKELSDILIPNYNSGKWEQNNHNKKKKAHLEKFLPMADLKIDVLNAPYPDDGEWVRL